SVDELNRRKIRIVFFGPDNRRIHSAGTEATWKTGRTGKHNVRVELREATDGVEETVAQDSETVSVLSAEPAVVVTIDPRTAPEGTAVDLRAEPSFEDPKYYGIRVRWDTSNAGVVQPDPKDILRAAWDTTDLVPGSYRITAQLVDETGAVLTDAKGNPIEGEDTARIEFRPIAHGDTMPVTLRRSAVPQTRDQALWVAIRNRTKAIAFSGSGYKDFIDRVLCKRVTLRPGTPGGALLERELNELGTSVYGGGAYELLK